MSPRFSNLTIAERLSRNSRLDPATGCIEWTSTKSRGYGVLRVGGRKGKTFLAHRLSFEEAKGPIPDGMVICHHCDNPGCINLDHLFLGWQADNHADMTAKGRNPIVRGVDNGQHVLTEDEVRSIRAAKGVSMRGLARRFGVTHPQIIKIRRRESWSHLS
jgi:hypothetical protein